MAVTHTVVGVAFENAPAGYVSEHGPKAGDVLTDQGLARIEKLVTARTPGVKLFVATDGPDAWRALWMRRGDRFSWIELTEDWDATMLAPKVRIADEEAADALPERLHGAAGEAILEIVWPSFDELVAALRALAAVMSTPDRVTALVETEGHRFRATVDVNQGFEISPVKWTVKGTGMRALATRLFKLGGPLPKFPFGEFQAVPRAPQATHAQPPPHDLAHPYTTGTAKRRVDAVENLHAAMPVEQALPIVTAALADPANEGDAWATVRQALYRRMARLPSNPDIIERFCAAIVGEPATFDELFTKIAPTAALEALSKRGLKSLPAPVAKRVGAILKKRKIG